MQSGIRANAYEGVHHRPAQSHRLGSTEPGVPPGARRFMVFGQAIFCVEEKIRIGEDH
jgi:hypothetical protein